MSISDNMTICENGHVYDKSLNICPHCPTTSAMKDNFSAGNNLDRTVAEENFGNLDRTVADQADDLNKTEIPGGETAKAGKDIDLSATYIPISDDEASTDQERTDKSRATKKIVGWLVSYSHDKMGRDYRLFEGRNTIGKGIDNSILIADDPSISKNHLTILYNNNNYYLSDEMSGNGTKINGKSIRPKDAIDIKDGDVIEIGITSLLFRTSF